MHSEYENLMVLSSFYFHFQQPGGKDRETQRWRETNLKRREKRFVFLLCGPVWLWRSCTSMPHCHPPSFPSVRSLLQPVSRKCPPSWHRHPHTHQKRWHNSLHEITKWKRLTNLKLKSVSVHSWKRNRDLSVRVRFLVIEVIFSRWCTCLWRTF